MNRRIRIIERENVLVAVHNSNNHLIHNHHLIIRANIIVNMTRMIIKYNCSKCMIIITKRRIKSIRRIRRIRIVTPHLQQQQHKLNNNISNNNR